MKAPLLRVQGLQKHFDIGGASGWGQKRLVRAVDGVSFDILAGETLGLVGESGCGKSTTGRLLLRLIEPSAGSVWFDGQEITALRGEALREKRRAMQIIFQDPFGSMNPRMRVRELVAEPLLIHGLAKGHELEKLVARMLDRVGLPASAMDRYPHEFSGGQRQRICIARALILQPRFVVADEAVSALDVSVQAQIINLMRDLQQELGLTYLFISHNLAVVRHISDRVAVMYLGHLVEVATAHQLFTQPQHPYTRMLLASLPADHPHQRRLQVAVQGDLPPISAHGHGCRLAERCPHVQTRCRTDIPVLLAWQASNAAHQVACHRVNDGTLPPALPAPANPL